MAAKDNKGSSYSGIHRLKAGVVLLSVFVVTISGLLAQVSLTTILVRSTIVFLAVVAISRVVVQILKTNEEMNSG